MSTHADSYFHFQPDVASEPLLPFIDPWMYVQGRIRIALRPVALHRPRQDMILIAGTLTFPPGGIEKARDAMQKVVEATRREAGCINYDFAVDISDPTRLVVFECWRDQTALDGHVGSPHLAEWRQAAAKAGPPRRNLSMWQVDEGHPL